MSDTNSGRNHLERIPQFWTQMQTSRQVARCHKQHAVRLGTQPRCSLFSSAFHQNNFEHGAILSCLTSTAVSSIVYVSVAVLAAQPRIAASSADFRLATA